jgi:hypothetical protein
MGRVQDVLTGEDLVLRLTFANFQRAGFIVPTASIATYANAALYAGAASYNNCYLWQAVQLNTTICDLVKAQTNTSGVTVPVQFIRTYSDVIMAANVGTVSSINRPLNASMGQSILRIYSSVFMTDDSITRNALSYNVAGALFSRWREYINQNATSDSALYLPDVYKQQLVFLKDSCISNYDHWTAMGSTIITDFSSLPGDGLVRVTPSNSGWSLLSVPQVNYAPEVTRDTNTKASTLYQWFVMCRIMRITPMGIELQ